MADLTRTVKVAFLGEDKVTKTIDGITGRIDSFAGRVSDATQPLANLTDNILKIEAAFAALAIGGMALAFNEFSKFESASAELAKVLDLQSESLDTAQQKAIELSGTYGEASDTILQSFAKFRQAGFDLAESMTLTKDSLDLAIAGDLELADATNIITGTLKGFKAEAGDARTIIDALNEVSNNYATSAGELGEGLRILSPIANQMGLSFQQTIGILTPIIEVFQSGSEAGTAMRTTLLKLTDDTKPVVEALAALGISQRDANGQLKFGRDILYEVATAFGGLGETEKAYYASQLTGIRQAGKAVEVFDQLEKVINVTNTAMNSAGSAAREVEIRLKTAEVQMDRFVVAIKNVGAAVGAELAPGFTAALTSVTDFINELRDLIGEGDAFAPLFKLFSDLGFDIAKIFDSMKINLEDALEGVDLDKFIESLEGVVDEVVGLFKSFFGDIDLTSKEGLEAFLQRVIDSFTSLNNIVIGILGAFEPFVKKIGELAEKFADLNAEDAKSIGNFLGWAKVINTVANNIGALTGSINFLAQGLTVLTGVKILAAIKGLTSTGTAATGLLAIITKLSLVLAAPFAGFWLGSILRDNIPFVKEWGDKLGEVLWKLKDNEETMRRTEAAKYTEELGKLNVQLVQWGEALDDVDTDLEIRVDIATAGFFTDIDQAKFVLDHMPDKKEVDLNLNPNKAAAVKAFETIQIWVDDNESKEGGYWTELKFEVDKKALDDTKEKLEEIPAEKVVIAKIENQTELQIAKIIAGAETIQKAMEFKAQIEIAEVEQLFETLRAQSENIAAMFINTGEVITALSGAFEHLGALGRHDLLALMERELEIRANLAEQQGKLTEAELKYLDVKTKALESGDAFINIQVDGVYPELELIMHKLIEQTQVRANAEGLDFLLGT